MPEPIAAPPSVISPTPATAPAVAGAAASFLEQLRAVAPHETVNLGAMVSAHVDGFTPVVAGAAVTGATLGLGAMTRAAAMGGVAATGGVVTVTRAPTGDAAVTGKVVDFALSQQGKPYVFGTRGPDSYDCSGLVTAAYKQVGIDLPAYTFTQATYGRTVDTATEPIKAGDLIFVRGGRPAQDLGHVGIAISSTEWVVAPRTGDVVKTGPIPAGVQLVRRIVG